MRRSAAAGPRLGRNCRSIITFSEPARFTRARLNQCLHFLELHDGSGDAVEYARVLQACSKLKALQEGERVHAHIVKSGLQGDPLLGNHIVNMYAKCASPGQARRVFDSLSRRNLFSWTAIITAYAQVGDMQTTLTMFRKMQLEGVRADRVVFITVLDTLACPDALQAGVQIHGLVVNAGFQLDLVAANALINMYGKCGQPSYAQAAFEALEQRSVVTWTSAIAANSHSGRTSEALNLFWQMQQAGVRANLVTLVAVLEACEMVQLGRLVESCLSETGADIVAQTALVDMYGKCGCLDEARRVLEEMEYRNVVSWSAMIAAYSDHGETKQAFGLYHSMQLDGVRPDSVTLVTLLDACNRAELLSFGEQIHRQLVDNAAELDFDLVVQNSLVSMYGECGDVESASNVFQAMEVRDEISWNTMLAANAKAGECGEALRLFKLMLLSGARPGKATYTTTLCLCDDSINEVWLLHSCILEQQLEADIHVGTALVTAYGKCSAIDEATEIFCGLSERNTVSCTALIVVYAQHCSLCKNALYVLKQMQLQGIKPGTATLRAALEACSAAGSLAEGRKIHSLVLRLGRWWSAACSLGTALVHMYGKCGRLADAWSCFQAIELPDVVAWAVVAETYAQVGDGKTSLKLFRRMQQEGTRPSPISLVIALSACSHSGLVPEGHQLFSSLLVGDYHDIKASMFHYGCVLDMLGRAGQLQLAEEFINRLPVEAVPGPAWTALLGACRSHGDVERGKRVAAAMFELQPGAEDYVLLSNLLVDERGNRLS